MALRTDDGTEISSATVFGEGYRAGLGRDGCAGVTQRQAEWALRRLRIYPSDGAVTLYRNGFEDGLRGDQWRLLGESAREVRP